MNYKRLIETVALAVTFLACSLTLIYTVIHSGHPASFPNILCLIFAGISFCIFGFFTVALCETKFNSCYDSIFDPPSKGKSWAVLPSIFIVTFWIAIVVTLIGGIAPLFNAVSEEWKLAISICISIWLAYVIVVMIVFMAKILIARKRRKNAKS
jgi:hypothetical protein